MSLTAIIMLGGNPTSPQERLVLEAQRAAALDLSHLLESYDVRLIISSPEFGWFPQDDDAELELDPKGQPFHFGATLASLIEKYSLERVLYFGGGSAPLLDSQLMEMIVGMLLNAGTFDSRIPSHIALTNNLHSSDWLGITQAQDALEFIQTADRDNSLAWALQQSGLYEVRTLAGIRPASLMDLDTPSDLALMQAHPHCPSHLQSALPSNALAAIPVQAVLENLGREGSQAALIGRVSPLAWQALSKATQCWIRVYAEERGMVANQRLKRGEVRSLMGELLRLKGPEGFFKLLAEMADTAIIDSRVLMAEVLKELPSTPDRFASDLYLIDAIQNPWLKEFTQAAQEASIPILLGGHNVVAGGLYALAEILGGK